MVYFTKIYTLYIQKEQIVGKKTKQNTTMPRGTLPWVQALGLKVL
jgi:hypothetical protein